MEKKAEKEVVKKTAKPRKKAAVKKVNPIISKAVIRRYGLKK